MRWGNLDRYSLSALPLSGKTAKCRLPAHRYWRGSFARFRFPMPSVRSGILCGAARFLLISARGTQLLLRYQLHNLLNQLPQREAVPLSIFVSAKIIRSISWPVSATHAAFVTLTLIDRRPCYRLCSKWHREATGKGTLV